MAYKEKVTWVTLVVGVLVPIGYLWVVLPELEATSAADVAYQQPLLVAAGVSIVALIVGNIALAAGTAIESRVTGSGSVDEIDREDERDTAISRRSDVIGSYVASVGFMGALALTMLEADYFWIANAIYLSFVLGSVVSSTATIVSYRRGFSP